jgi:hypothetical protein
VDAGSLRSSSMADSSAVTRKVAGTIVGDSARGGTGADVRSTGSIHYNILVCILVFQPFSLSVDRKHRPKGADSSTMLWIVQL